MTTTSRRRTRLDPATRRAAILDEALIAFGERGYAETALTDVGRGIGVSKSGVYHYFETKEALFEAVLRERVVPIIVADEALVAEHVGSARELVATLVRRLWEVTSTPAQARLALVAQMELPRFPAAAELFMREVILRWRAVLRVALVRGIERGEFADTLDADALAEEIPMMVIGVVTAQLVLGAFAPSEVTEARRLDAMLALLDAGLA
jgi:AcrR family transcriptional regulator